LLRKDWRGELGKSGRRALGFLKDFHDRFRERFFCVLPQCHKPASLISYFPVRRYVRTDDPASSKEPFSHWKSEPFSQGGSYKHFALGVAPLQFRLGQAFEKGNAPAKTQGRYQSVNITGVWRRDSKNDELHLWTDVSGAQQSIEGPDQ
jgi:hypothetical protein